MRAAFAVAAASRGGACGVGGGCSLASALPSLRVIGGGGIRTTGIRCSSSSPSSISSATSLDHASFISDVAFKRSPENLPHLLNMLQARGETITSPAAKEGLIPLVIPLSQSPSGGVTSLLRWPTSPAEMEMPVVEVRKYGVWYLAKSIDQFIHRILVEEDAHEVRGSSDELWEAAAEVGMTLYEKGDLMKSGIADMDTYLLKKVGLFPDVIERKVARHLDKGDQVSALVTGEFYTRNHFPGFGRPFVFNAEVLLKVGRNREAKDAARGALKSPWWTLGCRYHEVAEIAQWDDEQVEYIKERVTEEGKLEDLKKGKPAEQVALDEAAFLLDLASVEGNWDEVAERVAACYVEAGLHDVAKFVLYRE